jgi:hypothetical protein
MNDESRFVDYSKPLPDDLDEHSRTLLKLAKVYVTAKKILAPSKEEVDRRAKEKRIKLGQARQELVAERKPQIQTLVNEARKQITPSLSEEERRKLGIRERGRPKGAKNRNVKISKTELYDALEKLAKSANQIGEELGQEEAAIVLGLGGARQLRRLLRKYGDERRWRYILDSLLVERK